MNSDKVNWVVKNGKVTKFAGILKRDVGKNISTKAVGSFAMEDVTHEYKYSEGTQACVILAAANGLVVVNPTSSYIGERISPIKQYYLPGL